MNPTLTRILIKLGLINVRRSGYCDSCGANITNAPPTSEGPRCLACENVNYKPVPSVPVLIVPADPEEVGREHGVYVVRRGIPPFVGQLALPGGFQIHYFPHVQETWQQAAVRETWEEIQISCCEDTVLQILTESSYDDRVIGARNLLIGQATKTHSIDKFLPTKEAIERKVIFPDDDEQLCFSIHRKALAMHWDSLGVKHNVDLTDVK